MWRDDDGGGGCGDGDGARWWFNAICIDNSDESASPAIVNESNKWPLCCKCALHVWAKISFSQSVGIGGRCNAKPSLAQLICYVNACCVCPTTPICCCCYWELLFCYFSFLLLLSLLLCFILSSSACCCCLLLLLFTTSCVIRRISNPAFLLWTSVCSTPCRMHSTLYTLHETCAFINDLLRRICTMRRDGQRQRRTEREREKWKASTISVSFSATETHGSTYWIVIAQHNQFMNDEAEHRFIGSSTVYIYWTPTGSIIAVRFVHSHQTIIITEAYRLSVFITNYHD